VLTPEVSTLKTDVQVSVWQLWFSKKKSIPVMFEPPCIIWLIRSGIKKWAGQVARM
jgi:hypothetical protein